MYRHLFRRLPMFTMLGLIQSSQRGGGMNFGNNIQGYLLGKWYLSHTLKQTQIPS